MTNIYESIKSPDIKTSIIFNLVAGNNTVLSCSFFFFLIIDLLFPAVIAHAQFLTATGELVMTIEMSAKDSKNRKEKLKHIQNYRS